MLQDRKPSESYRLGPLLHRDDFSGPELPNWQAETEQGGAVSARNGKLTIEVPAGATVWFRPRLSGPLAIEYDATLIQRGGPYDRVSDLNGFWMAQDPARPDRLLETRRSGAFADYDTLRTYYVGVGGNGNTTTRFRRYIGVRGNRPLRLEHDLRAPEFLLRPNVRQRIRLVACGPTVQFWRDGRCLFDWKDSEPYTNGWFGLRTVASHIEVERFRVYQLQRMASTE
jgi:hypothetical protein